MSCVVFTWCGCCVQVVWMYMLRSRVLQRSEKTETKRMAVDVSTYSSKVEAEAGGRGRGRTPPPRPPVPDDSDLLAVPPPRPPAPNTYSASPVPPPEAFLYGAPLVSSVPAHYGVPRVGGPSTRWTGPRK